MYLLYLIAIVTIVARGTQSSPQCTLRATNLNPEIATYKKSTIPYSVHWKLHTTPECYTTQETDPIRDATMEDATVDIQSMCSGVYTFMLRTINLQTFVTTTHFHNVTITKETWTRYRDKIQRIVLFELLDMLLDGLFTIQYKIAEALFEITRASIVTRQYLRDRLESTKTLESRAYQETWRHTDINTTHYNNMTRLTHGEYTMCDYFRWNRLGKVTYEVAFTLVDIFYDLLHVGDTRPFRQWYDNERQSQCNKERIY